MVSQPSSQKAMITSCALRLSERSDDRKLVLASCWVSVDPPCRTPPARALATIARPIARGSIPNGVRKRRSSMAMKAAGVIGSSLVDVDRLILDRAAPRDRTPFLAQQQHRGIVKRLQRAAERRGDDQPDDRDEQQRGKDVEAPAKPAPARLLRRLGRRRGRSARHGRWRRDRADARRRAAALPDAVPSIDPWP